VEERRARDRLTHRGAWKARGAKFREFLQLAGLKALSFKGEQAWLG